MTSPDIQVGPVGGVLFYALIGLVIVGVLFATGTGGALVFALFAAVAILAVFFLTKRITARFRGRRRR